MDKFKICEICGAVRFDRPEYLHWNRIVERWICDECELCIRRALEGTEEDE